MNLRRLFRKVYGIELPIKGGTGDSLDNAIVIFGVSTIDSINIEEQVLDLMHDLNDYDYELVELESINKGKYTYDKYVMKLQCQHTKRILLKTYYFDITNCRLMDLKMD
jgi:hypothetical protein